jgi:hypothetical protein
VRARRRGGWEDREVEGNDDDDDDDDDKIG